LNLGQRAKLSTKTKQGQSQLQRFALSSLGLSRQATRQRQATSELERQKLSEAMALGVFTKQAQAQKDIQKVFQKQIFKEEIGGKTLPGGLLFPKPRGGKTQRKWAAANLGFKLEVRRKGKFVSAFPGKAFSEKTAKRLAQQLVGGTPLASFRLTKVRAPRLTKVGGLPTFKPLQYRKPIKRGKMQFSSKTFIEKTKYRIDEPGEFRGITLKGIMAPRKKKTKKKKVKKRRRR